MSSYRLRKQMIVYAHRLDAKGFVANHDGNLSARLASDNRFLATPTARAKFDLKETDLITVDAGGKTKAGGAKIFGEWSIHAAIYKARPDVAAVVHAHAPYASSHGLSGHALVLDFWPEAIVSLGRTVPCVVDPATGFAAAALSASACLATGNGVWAWGTSLEQAYLRLELAEHLAKVHALARAAGTLRALPADAVAVLMDKRKKAGLLSPHE